MTFLRIFIFLWNALRRKLCRSTRMQCTNWQCGLHLSTKMRSCLRLDLLISHWMSHKIKTYSLYILIGKTRVRHRDFNVVISTRRPQILQKWVVMGPLAFDATSPLLSKGRIITIFIRFSIFTSFFIFSLITLKGSWAIVVGTCTFWCRQSILYVAPLFFF